MRHWIHNLTGRYALYRISYVAKATVNWMQILMYIVMTYVKHLSKIQRSACCMHSRWRVGRSSRQVGLTHSAQIIVNGCDVYEIPCVFS
jgi:hypothetical protein